MSQNLGDLVLEAAAAFGDDVAFLIHRRFRHERITFHQTGVLTRQVATWLLSKGLSPGDRIVIWAPNMPQYALLYFGAWLAGVVVVPIDVRSEQATVDRFVQEAAPRLGFKSEALPGAFGPPVEETIPLERLLELVADVTPAEARPEIGPQHLCEIAFTSGTTGVPKGVMLTHGNLLAETAAMHVAFPLQRGYRALSLLPLSHALEQTITLLLAYTSGVRVSYVPRVNTVTIARAMREGEITCLVLVPELLRRMLAGMERRARESGRWGRWQAAHRLAPWLPIPLRRLLFRPVHQALGGHLLFFGCGGAPLDVSLAQAWERMGIRVYEGYGLTETSAAAAINRPGAQRLGTVGRPIPGVEVRLADDGEILLRGPTVSQGYYNRPEVTAQIFKDGWFHSGDVGRFDPDGYLRVTGRSAFKLVLPDGRNVYPEDVERV
ncbi:MAG TPA: AMP-binding protein, partial [Chloroflexota bacterium]|nr:AMP-binding protein [Chloroflexota bacterium]